MFFFVVYLFTFSLKSRNNEFTLLTTNFDKTNSRYKKLFYQFLEFHYIASWLYIRFFAEFRNILQKTTIV